MQSLPTPQDFLGPDLAPGQPVPPSTTRPGFYLACTRGQIDVVTSVINSWVLGDQELKKLLSLGLHGAASTGPPWGPHPELVRYLLDQGAPLYERLPLDAARSGSPAVFQVLVDHGWDIHAPIKNIGPAVCSIAANEQLLRWFLDHGASATAEGILPPCPMYAAVEGGSVASVRLLLSRGATLDGFQMSDCMPYNVAVNTKISDEASIEMLDFMLASGHFDVNAGDNDEGPIYKALSPLTGAVRGHSVRRVRHLLAKVAVPSHRSIMHARIVRDQTGDATILRLLEQARAEKALPAAPDEIPDTHPIYFAPSVFNQANSPSGAGGPGAPQLRRV